MFPPKFLRRRMIEDMDAATEGAPPRTTVVGVGVP